MQGQQFIFTSLLTFYDLATDMLRSVIRSAQTNRIDLVSGMYRIHAINNTDRDRKEKGTSVRFTSLLPGNALKQWAKFLNSSYDKRTLILPVTECFL